MVPVRDMTDGLRATLRAIPEVGELLVVDDGSRDPGAVRRATDDAAPAGVAVRVLRNERAAGPGAARERGWRATSRPIVAFVDAEVAADADWLTRLLPHFADPTLGAVAPRVRATPGRAPRHCSPGTKRCGRRSTGARAPPRCGRVPPWPTCPPPRS